MADRVDVSELEPIAAEQATEQQLQGALQPSHYNTATDMTSHDHARGRGTARPAAVALGLARTLLLLLLTFAAAAAEAASQSRTHSRTRTRTRGADCNEHIEQPAIRKGSGVHAQWAGACMESFRRAAGVEPSDWTGASRVPSRAVRSSRAAFSTVPPASSRTAAMEAHDCLLTHDALL